MDWRKWFLAIPEDRQTSSRSNLSTATISSAFTKLVRFAAFRRLTHSTARNSLIGSYQHRSATAVL